MIEQIVFYCFAAMLIFSAGMVVSMRNPVVSVLFLVLSFFSCAAIWLLLQAEFLIRQKSIGVYKATALLIILLSL